MLDVKIDAQFDFLGREYAELFARSSATAFQHPNWLSGLYKRLVPSLKAEPLIVTVREQDSGRLVMVLPLLRRRYGALRVVEFADLGVSDYASPIGSDASIAAILGDKAACAAIKNTLKPFDVLRIQKLRADSPKMEGLVGAPARASMSMSAHAVPLDNDFSTWRATRMAASYRKELDKKSRQLHRKGNVTFARTTDVEAIKLTLHKMREYRRPRFETGDLLQQQAYFDFYFDTATRRNGALARVYALSMDGCPIAGVMGLAHQGSFLVILGGFDLANYKNVSLGSLMFEQVARHCIEMGDRELDFTIGDEPYKTLFGAQACPMYQISRAGSPLGAVAGLVIEQVPWVRTVAKRFMRASRAAVASGAATPAEARAER